VIGDHVNLASRLESANKRYDTFFMISEFTHSHLSADLFRTRILDVIKVKGKFKAVKVYEVYEETSKAMAPEDECYYRIYDEAFTSFLAKDFTTAREKFEAALHIRPSDPASKGMMARMAGLKPAELPDNWDGSVELNSK
jgi:adenylate cyclase